MPRRRTSQSGALNMKMKSADAHVGARVRSRRIQLGISQTRLGKALGVSFQQVQKYERGFNRISASRLQAIASMLGVSPSYFFENQLSDATQPSGDPAVIGFNEFLGSTDGVRLMQAFVKIKNKATQEAIVTLISRLAN